MPHPNDMTSWEHIACARTGEPGHHHVATSALVDLGAPHGYADLPQVPARLAVRFPMFVWDPAEHPVDGGAYCPAHDAVSETIVSHGIWEPRETILILDVLSSGTGAGLFLDIGAQVGWFSLCALASGRAVLAVDAELENLGLLARSASEVLAGLPNDGWAELDTMFARLGPASPPFRTQRYRMVKIDIEGAEAYAIDALMPSLVAGLVDHVLMEVSPVFKPGAHYPDLVAGMIGLGYEAYRLPPKRRPPVEYVDAESFLAPYRFDNMPPAEMRAMVESWHQEDVWFRRQGAAW